MSFGKKRAAQSRAARRDGEDVIFISGLTEVQVRAPGLCRGIFAHS